VEKPSRLEVGGADPTKKLPECRPHVHFQKSGTSLNSKKKKSHLNVHARPPQQTRTSSPKVFAHSTTLSFSHPTKPGQRTPWAKHIRCRNNHSPLPEKDLSAKSMLCNKKN
jgi:hypothetical protein